MCPPFANGSWFNTTLKRQVGKELVICWGRGSFCYSILTICICKTKGLRAPVPSNHHCSKKKKKNSVKMDQLCSVLHWCHGVEDTSRAIEKLHFQFCLILLKLLHIVSVLDVGRELSCLTIRTHNKLCVNPPFPRMQETEAGGSLSPIMGSWMTDCIGTLSQSPVPFCFPGLLYAFWGEGVAARISCSSC